jgi:membrane protein DedA with SNARE-associated domain
MMQQLAVLLLQYGLLLVFANVFLEQAGAPVPAVPMLLVAGALTVSGWQSLTMIIVVAVCGSMLGDLIWYIAGRIYGLRILQLLCRISISPDSCVRQTENRFVRWGAPSLVFAKFVPGFSTVAPPLAGASGIKPVPFLAYSAIGAALWAGLAAGAGVLFYRQIDWALEQLSQMGVYALILIGILLILFIAVKWRERQRFFNTLRMARISVDDLYKMMQDGETPVVVDVRSQSAREIDPRRVPGSIPVDIRNVDAYLAQLPPDRDIIVYCT